jgi:hypothetical protein
VHHRHAVDQRLAGSLMQHLLLRRVLRRLLLAAALPERQRLEALRRRAARQLGTPACLH